MRQAFFLNAATLMRTDTWTVLQAARAAGFAGIEARAERLLSAPAEAKQLERAPDGAVLSLNALRLPLTQDGQLVQPALEAEAVRLLELAQMIRARYLLVVPPRVPGLGFAAARVALGRALAGVARAAGTVGVRVAFEFLGFPDSPVRTLEAALELVQPLEGVGLVMDACHLYMSGGGIPEIPVERIALVHLNDAAKPPGVVEDAERLLPGEGRVPLGAYVERLARLGFCGPWSVETFNPAHWGEDPKALCVRAFGAVRAVVTDA